MAQSETLSRPANASQKVVKPSPSTPGPIKADHTSGKTVGLRNEAQQVKACGIGAMVKIGRPFDETLAASLEGQKGVIVEIHPGDNAGCEPIIDVQLRPDVLVSCWREELVLLSR